MSVVNFGYRLAKAFLELDDEDPRKKIFSILIIVAVLFVALVCISICIMLVRKQ